MLAASIRNEQQHKRDMPNYVTNSWKEFRKCIIELDGNKCSACGKNGPDVVLQVHHKKYIEGLKPWEYALKDCVTLCKGCHASEHGFIKPKIDWVYQGEEDLGDLIGTCENCGSALRHVFYIFHQNWGTMEVGTYCCDSLTESEIASNLMESQRRFDDRKKRFFNSKRWKYENDKYSIRQSNFDIEIHPKDSNFFIQIQKIKSTKSYNSLDEAKNRVFDIIESGELKEYFKNNNISIESINKRHVNPKQ